MNTNRCLVAGRKPQSGQMILIYALVFPVLFLFMGLGIDAALIYHSKAKLSRAIDAASLRLARKFNVDEATRRNMAVRLMQINYPGFFKEGFTYSRTGTYDAGEGEVITFQGSNNQRLVMTTFADPDTGVVEVSLSGTTQHKTFFMPLAGKDFQKVNFNGVAAAQRFPACNVLVLDISGSMRGARATNLVAGVSAFVNEFVDDRDYMMVVTFSTYGKVVWPNIPNADGNFFPSRGFLSGNISLAPGNGVSFSGSVNDIVGQFVRFAGATNAAEGMRFAFEQADRFLNSIPPNQRNLIKMNYVFFTDGEFNTFRGFARGVGYGIAIPSNPRFPTLTAEAQAHPVAELPDFHLERPVFGSQYINGGRLEEADGTAMIFNNYSRSTGTNYNLRTLISDINPASLTGVNAVVQGFRLRSGHWKTPFDAANTANFRTTASGMNINFPSAAWWETAFFQHDPGSPTGTSQVTGLSAADLKLAKEREMFKMQRDHSIYYPVSGRFSLAPGHPQRFADRALENFPGGRFYANTTSSTDAQGNGTVEGIYLERSGTGQLGPEHEVTGNYQRWNYATMRMNRFYPRYSYGGPYNWPADSQNPSSGSQARFDEADMDTFLVGPPTHFYSFRDGGWVTVRDNSEGRITAEGDWLAEVQAWVARKQQKATIYSILLGSGGPATVRRLANDNSGVPFYPDQKLGRYYATTVPTTLPAIFREIAQKISVRLSE